MCRQSNEKVYFAKEENRPISSFSNLPGRETLPGVVVAPSTMVASRAQKCSCSVFHTLTVSKWGCWSFEKCLDFKFSLLLQKTQRRHCLQHTQQTYVLRAKTPTVNNKLGEVKLKLRDVLLFLSSVYQTSSPSISTFTSRSTTAWWSWSIPTKTSTKNQHQDYCMDFSGHLPGKISFPRPLTFADSAQTEYCSTFHCPFVRSSVCHRRDISHFSHI